MLLNMQLSVLLSAARLQLNLVWRPRDENSEADALTNGIFDGIELSDRIEVSYGDLPLDLVHDLWKAKREFDEAKEKASTTETSSGHATSKKFDKSPW